MPSPETRREGRSMLATRSRHGVKRTGTRLSLRSWVAWYLQGRRRHRAAPSSPPAPVITQGWYAWADTEPGWVDNYITIAFDAGTVPPGVFEVWEHDFNNSLRLLGTIPSEGLVDYHH